MIVNNTKMLKIKEALHILKDSPYINKLYNNFDNTLKLFTHRTMRKKFNSNNTIKFFFVGDGYRKDTKNISFNENSIVYTSTQNSNNISNETFNLTIICHNYFLKIYIFVYLYINISRYLKCYIVFTYR